MMWRIVLAWGDSTHQCNKGIFDPRICFLVLSAIEAIFALQNKVTVSVLCKSINTVVF